MQRQLKRRWSWRRRIWTLSAVGIGLPLMWAAWVLLRWPAAIEISYETTRLTEPVTSDGYIDYFELARREYRAAGGVTRQESGWVSLYRNETVAPTGLMESLDQIQYQDEVEEQLVTAPAASSDGTMTRNDVRWRLRSTPWTADEFPHAAAAIEANEEWYRTMAHAWQPLDVLRFSTDSRDDRNAGSILLPGTEADRRFARRLWHRACLRIGSGDHADSFRDLDLLRRIVARQGPFMIQWNVRNAIETQTSRVMIIALLSCDELTSDMLRLVEQSPVGDSAEELIHILDQWDRYVQLDLIQKTHRNRRLDDWTVTLGTYQQEWLTGLLHRIVCNRIDYDAWMRAFNDVRDQQVNLMRTRSWRDSRDAIRQMQQGTKMTDALQRLRQARLVGPWPGTEDVIPLYFESDLLVITWDRVPRQLLRRRAVQIVARLAVWKQTHGAFPESLEQILSMPEFPRAIERLTIDPYSGEPLLFQKTETGFELRSVGDNRRRDADGLVELESAQVITPDGAPDDIIWRWPVVDWNIPQRPP